MGLKAIKSARAAANEVNAVAAGISKAQQAINKDTMRLAEQTDSRTTARAGQQKAIQKENLVADLDNAKTKALTATMGTILGAASFVSGALNKIAAHQEKKENAKTGTKLVAEGRKEIAKLKAEGKGNTKEVKNLEKKIDALEKKIDSGKGLSTADLQGAQKEIRDVRTADAKGALTSTSQNAQQSIAAVQAVADPKAGSTEFKALESSMTDLKSQLEGQLTDVTAESTQLNKENTGLQEDTAKLKEELKGVAKNSPEAATIKAKIAANDTKLAENTTKIEAIKASPENQKKVAEIKQKIAAVDAVLEKINPKEFMVKDGVKQIGAFKKELADVAKIADEMNATEVGGGAPATKQDIEGNVAKVKELAEKIKTTTDPAKLEALKTELRSATTELAAQIKSTGGDPTALNAAVSDLDAGKDVKGVAQALAGTDTAPGTAQTGAASATGAKDANAVAGASSLTDKPATVKEIATATQAVKDLIAQVKADPNNAELKEKLKNATLDLAGKIETVADASEAGKALKGQAQKLREAAVAPGGIANAADPAALIDGAVGQALGAAQGIEAAAAIKGTKAEQKNPGFTTDIDAETGLDKAGRDGVNRSGDPNFAATESLIRAQEPDFLERFLAAYNAKPRDMLERKIMEGGLKMMANMAGPGAFQQRVLEDLAEMKMEDLDYELRGDQTSIFSMKKGLNTVLAEKTMSEKELSNATTAANKAEFGVQSAEKELAGAITDPVTQAPLITNPQAQKALIDSNVASARALVREFKDTGVVAGGDQAGLERAQNIVAKADALKTATKTNNSAQNAVTKAEKSVDSTKGKIADRLEKVSGLRDEVAALRDRLAFVNAVTDKTGAGDEHRTGPQREVKVLGLSLGRDNVSRGGDALDKLDSALGAANQALSQGRDALTGPTGSNLTKGNSPKDQQRQAEWAEKLAKIDANSFKTQHRELRRVESEFADLVKGDKGSTTSTFARNSTGAQKALFAQQQHSINAAVKWASSERDVVNLKGGSDDRKNAAIKAGEDLIANTFGTTVTAYQAPKSTVRKGAEAVADAVVDGVNKLAGRVTTKPLERNAAGRLEILDKDARGDVGRGQLAALEQLKTKGESKLVGGGLVAKRDGTLTVDTAGGSGDAKGLRSIETDLLNLQKGAKLANAQNSGLESEAALFSDPQFQALTGLSQGLEDLSVGFATGDIAGTADKLKALSTDLKAQLAASPEDPNLQRQVAALDKVIEKVAAVVTNDATIQSLTKGLNDQGGTAEQQETRRNNDPALQKALQAAEVPKAQLLKLTAEAVQGEVKAILDGPLGEELSDDQRGALKTQARVLDKTIDKTDDFIKVQTKIDNLVAKLNGEPGAGGKPATGAEQADRRDRNSSLKTLTRESEGLRNQVSSLASLGGQQLNAEATGEGSGFLGAHGGLLGGSRVETSGNTQVRDDVRDGLVEIRNKAEKLSDGPQKIALLKAIDEQIANVNTFKDVDTSQIGLEVTNYAKALTAQKPDDHGSSTLTQPTVAPTVVGAKGPNVDVQATDVVTAVGGLAPAALDTAGQLALAEKITALAGTTTGTDKAQLLAVAEKLKGGPLSADALKADLGSVTAIATKLPESPEGRALIKAVEAVVAPVLDQGQKDQLVAKINTLATAVGGAAGTKLTKLAEQIAAEPLGANLTDELASVTDLATGVESVEKQAADLLSKVGGMGVTASMSEGQKTELLTKIEALAGTAPETDQTALRTLAKAIKDGPLSGEALQTNLNAVTAIAAKLPESAEGRELKAAVEARIVPVMSEGQKTQLLDRINGLAGMLEGPAAKRLQDLGTTIGAAPTAAGLNALTGEVAGLQSVGKQITDVVAAVDAAGPTGVMSEGQKTQLADRINALAGTVKGPEGEKLAKLAAELVTPTVGVSQKDVLANVKTTAQGVQNSAPVDVNGSPVTTPGGNPSVREAGVGLEAYILSLTATATMSPAEKTALVKGINEFAATLQGPDAAKLTELAGKIAQGPASGVELSGYISQASTIVAKQGDAATTVSEGLGRFAAMTDVEKGQLVGKINALAATLSGPAGAQLTAMAAQIGNRTTPPADLTTAIAAVTTITNGQGASAKAILGGADAATASLTETMTPGQKSALVQGINTYAATLSQPDSDKLLALAKKIDAGATFGPDLAGYVKQVSTIVGQNTGAASDLSTAVAAVTGATPDAQVALTEDQRTALADKVNAFVGKVSGADATALQGFATTIADKDSTPAALKEALDGVSAIASGQAGNAKAVTAGIAAITPAAGRLVIDALNPAQRTELVAKINAFAGTLTGPEASSLKALATKIGSGTLDNGALTSAVQEVNAITTGVKDRIGALSAPTAEFVSGLSATMRIALDFDPAGLSQLSPQAISALAKTSGNLLTEAADTMHMLGMFESPAQEAAFRSAAATLVTNMQGLAHANSGERSAITANLGLARNTLVGYVGGNKRDSEGIGALNPTAVDGSLMGAGNQVAIDRATKTLASGGTKDDATRLLSKTSAVLADAVLSSATTLGAAVATGLTDPSGNVGKLRTAAGALQNAALVGTDLAEAGKNLNGTATLASVKSAIVAAYGSESKAPLEVQRLLTKFQSSDKKTSADALAQLSPIVRAALVDVSMTDAVDAVVNQSAGANTQAQRTADRIEKTGTQAGELAEALTAGQSFKSLFKVQGSVLPTPRSEDTLNPQGIVPLAPGSKGQRNDGETLSKELTGSLSVNITDGSIGVVTDALQDIANLKTGTGTMSELVTSIGDKAAKLAGSISATSGRIEALQTDLKTLTGTDRTAALAELRNLSQQLFGLTQLSVQLGSRIEEVLADPAVSGNMKLAETLKGVKTSTIEALETVKGVGASKLLDVGGVIDAERGALTPKDTDAAKLRGDNLDFFDQIDLVHNHKGAKGDRDNLRDVVVNQSAEYVDNLAALLGEDHHLVLQLRNAAAEYTKAGTPEAKAKAFDAFVHARLETHLELGRRFGVESGPGTVSTDFSVKAVTATVSLAAEQAALQLAAKRAALDALQSGSSPDRKAESAKLLTEIDGLLDTAGKDHLIGGDALKTLKAEIQQLKDKNNQGAISTDALAQFKVKLDGVADRFVATALTSASAGVQLSGAFKALSQASSRTAAENSGGAAKAAIQKLVAGGYLSAEKAANLNKSIDALVSIQGGSGELWNSDAFAERANQFAKGLDALVDSGLIKGDDAAKATGAAGKLRTAALAYYVIPPTGVGALSAGRYAALAAFKSAVNDTKAIGQKLLGAAGSDAGHSHGTLLDQIAKETGGQVDFAATSAPAAYDRLRQSTLNKAKDLVANAGAVLASPTATPQQKEELKAAAQILQLNGTWTKDQADQVITALDAADPAAARTLLAKDGPLAKTAAGADLGRAGDVAERAGTTAADREIIGQLDKGTARDLKELATVGPDSDAGKAIIQRLLGNVKTAADLGLITQEKANELTVGLKSLNTAIRKDDITQAFVAKTITKEAADQQIDALTTASAETVTSTLAAVGQTMKAALQDTAQDPVAAKADLHNLVFGNEAEKFKALGNLKGRLDQAVSNGLIDGTKAKEIKVQLDAAAAVAGVNTGAQADRIGKLTDQFGDASQRIGARFDASRYGSNATVSGMMHDQQVESASLGQDLALFKTAGKNGTLSKAQITELQSRVGALMDSHVISAAEGQALLKQLAGGKAGGAMAGLDQKLAKVAGLVEAAKFLVDRKLERNTQAISEQMAGVAAGEIDALMPFVERAMAGTKDERHAVVSKLADTINALEEMAGINNDPVIDKQINTLRALRNTLTDVDSLNSLEDRPAKAIGAIASLKTTLTAARAELASRYHMDAAKESAPANLDNVRQGARNRAYLEAASLVEAAKSDPASRTGLVESARKLEVSLDGIEPDLTTPAGKAFKALDVASDEMAAAIGTGNDAIIGAARDKLVKAIEGVRDALKGTATVTTPTVAPITTVTDSSTVAPTTLSPIEQAAKKQATTTIDKTQLKADLEDERDRNLGLGADAQAKLNIKLFGTGADAAGGDQLGNAAFAYLKLQIASGGKIDAGSGAIKADLAILADKDATDIAKSAARTRLQAAIGAGVTSGKFTVDQGARLLTAISGKSKREGLDSVLAAFQPSTAFLNSLGVTLGSGSPKENLALLEKAERRFKGLQAVASGKALPADLTGDDLAFVEKVLGDDPTQRKEKAQAFLTERQLLGNLTAVVEKGLKSGPGLEVAAQNSGLLTNASSLAGYLKVTEKNKGGTYTQAVLDGIKAERTAIAKSYKEVGRINDAIDATDDLPAHKNQLTGDAKAKKIAEFEQSLASRYTNPKERLEMATYMAELVGSDIGLDDPAQLEAVAKQVIAALDAAKLTGPARKDAWDILQSAIVNGKLGTAAQLESNILTQAATLIRQHVADKQDPTNKAYLKAAATVWGMLSDTDRGGMTAEDITRTMTSGTPQERQALVEKLRGTLSKSALNEIKAGLIDAAGKAYGDKVKTQYAKDLVSGGSDNIIKRVRDNSGSLGKLLAAYKANGGDIVKAWNDKSLTGDDRARFAAAYGDLFKGKDGNAAVLNVNNATELTKAMGALASWTHGQIDKVDDALITDGPFANTQFLGEIASLKEVTKSVMEQGLTGVLDETLMGQLTSQDFGSRFATAGTQLASMQDNKAAIIANAALAQTADTKASGELSVFVIANAGLMTQAKDLKVLTELTGLAVGMDGEAARKGEEAKNHMAVVVKKMEEAGKVGISAESFVGILNTAVGDGLAGEIFHGLLDQAILDRGFDDDIVGQMIKGAFKDMGAGREEAQGAKEKAEKSLKAYLEFLKAEEASGKSSELKGFMGRLASQSDIASATLIAARRALGVAANSSNPVAIRQAVVQFQMAKEAFKQTQDVVASFKSANLSSKEPAAEGQESSGGGTAAAATFDNMVSQGMAQEANGISDQAEGLIRSVTAIAQKTGTVSDLRAVGEAPAEAVTKGMSVGAIVKQLLRKNAVILGTGDVRGQASSSTDGPKVATAQTLDAQSRQSFSLGADGNSVIDDHSPKTKGASDPLTSEVDRAEATFKHDMDAVLDLLGNGSAMVPKSDDRNFDKKMAKISALATATEKLLAGPENDKLDGVERGAVEALATKVRAESKALAADPTNDAVRQELNSSIDRLQSMIHGASLSGMSPADRAHEATKVINRVLGLGSKVANLAKGLSSSALSEDVATRVLSNLTRLVPGQAAALGEIRTAIEEGRFDKAAFKGNSVQAKLEALKTLLASDALQAKKTGSGAVTADDVAVVPPVQATGVVTDAPLSSTAHAVSTGVNVNNVSGNSGRTTADAVGAVKVGRGTTEAEPLISKNPLVEKANKAVNASWLARSVYDQRATEFETASANLQTVSQDYLSAQLALVNNANLPENPVAPVGATVLPRKREDAANVKFMGSDGREHLAAEFVNKLEGHDGVKGSLESMAADVKAKLQGMTEAFTTLGDVNLAADMAIHDLRAAVGTGGLGGEDGLLKGSLSAATEALSTVLKEQLKFHTAASVKDDAHASQANLNLGRLAKTQGLQQQVMAATSYTGGDGVTSLQDQAKAGAKRVDGLQVQLDTLKGQLGVAKTAQTGAASLDAGATTTKAAIDNGVGNLRTALTQLRSAQAAFAADPVAGKAAMETAQKAVKAAGTALGNALNDPAVATALRRDPSLANAITRVQEAIGDQGLDKYVSDALSLPAGTDQKVKLTAASGRLDELLGTGASAGTLSNLNAAAVLYKQTTAGNKASADSRFGALDQQVGRVTNQLATQKRDNGVVQGQIANPDRATQDLIRGKVPGLFGDGAKKGKTGSIATTLGDTSQGNKTLMAQGAVGNNLTTLKASIERIDTLKNRIIDGEQMTNPVEKQKVIKGLRAEVRTQATVDTVEGKQTTKENKVRKARSDYMAADTELELAKQEGASPAKIKQLEKKADDAAEAILDARGETWRDGLAEFFGGPIGAQVANGIKYMIEQAMEMVKQRRRVSQLSALYAQAVAEEQKLTADIAMYAMPQGTHK